MRRDKIDVSHAGIQLVEQMRQTMDENSIRKRLSEHSSDLQRKCMKALQSGGIPEESDIRALHKIEVASAYAAIVDINNSQSKLRLSNAQNGLSPTGTRLMSKFLEQEREKALHKKIEVDREYEPGNIQFRM